MQGSVSTMHVCCNDSLTYPGTSLLTRSMHLGRTNAYIVRDLSHVLHADITPLKHGTKIDCLQRSVPWVFLTGTYRMRILNQSKGMTVLDIHLI
jgi:hypothetical protein